ncbi:unnamed protein product, partial [Polarella glacialis]
MASAFAGLVRPYDALAPGWFENARSSYDTSWNQGWERDMPTPPWARPSQADLHHPGPGWAPSRPSQEVRGGQPLRSAGQAEDGRAWWSQEARAVSHGGWAPGGFLSPWQDCAGW